MLISGRFQDRRGKAQLPEMLDRRGDASCSARQPRRPWWPSASPEYKHYREFVFACPDLA
jgi:hypothetical protein